MNKTALVTGITGQDGAYLAKLLLDKGYEVFGGYRRTSELLKDKLEYLGIENDIRYVSFELLELSNIQNTIKKIKPDEFYNLAAQSFVGVSFEQPLSTTEVTGNSVLRILDSLKSFSPDTKFYQASTSELFGKAQTIPQNEETPFYPRSPYSIAKQLAHWFTKNYRESYDLFTCSGILFNHESPLRGLDFVTRKVTDAVAKIKYGLQDKVILGNLDSKRDWGYAKEYVKAMWLMLQQEKAEDYVIATGETHSIREFVEQAFERAEIPIEWKGTGLETEGLDIKTGKTVVGISPDFFRPAEVDLLIGDASKAKKELGWQARTSFKELVAIMMEADLQRVRGK